MPNKSYKFRLYPTKKQIATLQWTLDRCRELYNAALQERKEIYTYTGKGTTYTQQANQLPEIKEFREEYLNIHSQVLQDVLRRVDKAFKAFFRRVQNGEEAGYPRFQGQGRYDSFTYPQSGFSIEQGKLDVSKIGQIKMKCHREMQGNIRTCTIKREGQHWYVCLSCEVDVRKQQRLPYTDDSVGIDLGVYHFATLSTGDVIDNPRCYRKAEKNLIKAQQTLSRRKRGSKRWRKAAQRLGMHHRKVKNQRQNFLHQWSRRLVNTYQTLVFENLEPSTMSKRPKPKQDEETGQYVPNGARKKVGLNKSIMDAAWSTFVSLCQYKAACAGTVQVIKVDPYKTSQVCSGCLAEGPHKDLSERTHTCEHCGLVLDRDVNAAVNVLAVSHGLNLRPQVKKRSKVTRRAKKRSKVARTELLASGVAAD